MKRFAKLTVILPLLLLLLALPLGFVPMGSDGFGHPTNVAYAAPSATVYLPNTRFAKFDFQQQTDPHDVSIVVSQLDSRLKLGEFYKDIIIKRASGVVLAYDVDYQYYVYSNTAIIVFVLEAEDVYITLSPRLDSLPSAILNAPSITTILPILVNQKSYEAITNDAEYGTINLTISSLNDNPTILTRAAGAFVGYVTEAEYHMNVSLTRTRRSDQTEETELFYFCDSEILRLKVKIPDYNKKYSYALLEELGARGVRVTTLQPTQENGFYYVNISLEQNGNFSIIACMERMILPWWGIVLIALGGTILLAAVVFLSFLPRIKKWKKNKMRSAGEQKYAIPETDSDTEQTRKTDGDNEEKNAENGKPLPEKEEKKASSANKTAAPEAKPAKKVVKKNYPEPKKK